MSRRRKKKAHAREAVRIAYRIIDMMGRPMPLGYFDLSIRVLLARQWVQRYYAVQFK